MIKEQTKKDINIFLTEKFIGECYHDYIFSKEGYTNRKCGKCGVIGHNQDLFTPTGFFLLWEKAQQNNEWWEEFIKVTSMGKIHRFISSADAYFLVRVEEVNYLTFPALLAEYLGWRE